MSKEKTFIPTPKYIYIYIPMKYTKKLISCKIQGIKGKKSTFIGNINGLKQCIRPVLKNKMVD